MTVLRLVAGDCLLVMPTLESGSVDAIVTDPPYGLGFMGKDWDHGIPGVHFWEAALRVAKPGAHLVAFGGTRTFHRLTCAIEDAGWEIRDCLSYLYGSGFPKSHNGPWGGTALKPAWEPVILARKPLSGTVAQTVQAHGTGALNIDASRIGPPTDTRRAKGAGSGAFPHSDDAWEPHIAVGGQNTAGRWPANVLLDEEAARMLDEQSGECKSGMMLAGTAEGRGMFALGGEGMKSDTYGDTGGASRFFFVSKEQICERNGQGVSGAVILCASCATASAPSPAPSSPDPGKSKAGPGSIDGSESSILPRSHVPTAEPLGNTGTIPTMPTYCASCGCALGATVEPISSVNGEKAEVVNVQVEGTRFLYTSKASRAEREIGLEGGARKAKNWSSGEQSPGTFQSPNTDRTSTNHHPTVKPLDLMRWLCRLVTPPGGVILDPFCGSGTTGMAALEEGFGFIGIELQPEYLSIAEQRIRGNLPLLAQSLDVRTA